MGLNALIVPPVTPDLFNKSEVKPESIYNNFLWSILVAACPTGRQQKSMHSRPTTFSSSTQHTHMLLAAPHAQEPIPKVTPPRALPYLCPLLPIPPLNNTPTPNKRQIGRESPRKPTTVPNTPWDSVHTTTSPSMYPEGLLDDDPCYLLLTPTNHATDLSHQGHLLQANLSRGALEAGR